MSQTLIRQVLEQNRPSPSLNKDITIFLETLLYCTSAFLATIPWQALLPLHAAELWAARGPATASLPWDGQPATLARSALEKERAASCRLLSHESPRPIRKSKGSCVQSSALTRKPEQQREAANHLAARCGSLQQQWGPRGRGARVRPCHGQGSPCYSSAEQPQAERLGSLSRPCSPNSRSSNCFAGGENSAVTYHCEAGYLL